MGLLARTALSDVTIESVRLIDYKIPRTKAFVTAKGQSDYCYGIYILIDAKDGAGKEFSALGDCLPRTKVTSESAADAWAGARSMAAELTGKQLTGKTPAEDLAQVRELLHGLDDIAEKQTLTWKKPPPRNKQLRATLCGFDEALLDLAGQSLGVPIYEILGGAKRKEVSVSAMTFNADTPTDELDAKVDDTAENFAALRLKVGLDDDEDIKKLELVAKELRAKNSPAIIWVDANQAWHDADGAISMLGKIRAALKAADFQTTFICEQPTLETDLASLAATTKKMHELNDDKNSGEHFKIVIMADESMWTLDDAKEVVANNAADFVNIKIQKAGGLIASKDIGDYLAQAAPNMGVYVGGVVATDVTSWANLQLCYALPRLDYATGCIPRRAYKVNVASIPVEYSKGKALVHPTAPGLGTGLDMSKLQEYIRRDTASPTTQNATTQDSSHVAN
jgi:L-alanine-DL-glutamate epimerase-like enolase superfamily enzyme